MPAAETFIWLMQKRAAISASGYSPGNLIRTGSHGRVVSILQVVPFDVLQG
jgi:hypothetical protein